MAVYKNNKIFKTEPSWNVQKPAGTHQSLPLYLYAAFTKWRQIQFAHKPKFAALRIESSCEKDEKLLVARQDAKDPTKTTVSAHW